MVSNENTEVKEPDVTEVLVPAAQNRNVTLGVEPHTVTYTQRPISFYGKLEVFSVLGSALNKAMSGPDGLELSDLLNGPAQAEASLSQQNFRDADTFVKAIAKLVQYTPDLLLDLYVVFLAVPRGDRELVKELLSRSEEDGGLSDEDGFGILETFVDQNWDVMVDFFNQKLVPLFSKIGTKVSESQPSKPSKDTQPATPSQ